MAYLPLKKLLSEYFFKEDLQKACRIIDEPTSYNNDKLISIIQREWERHGNDKYDLFDILDRPTLSRICDAYNLDHRGNKSELLKRLKKEKILEDGKKKKILIFGGISGVGGISALAIVSYLGLGFAFLTFIGVDISQIQSPLGSIVAEDFDVTNRPLIAGDQVRITSNSLLFDVKNFGEIPNESGQRKILVVMTNSSEGLTKEILSQRPGDVNSLMVIMPSQKISIILEEEILQAIDLSIQSNMDLFLGIVLEYNYGDNKTGEYGYIGKYNPDEQYFDVIESWAN